MTFAQLSFQLMQHLATQTLAFSTEIAQIFRARKAKNSRICCKILASFSSARCTKLLTSAKFSFEAAPRPRLSQCSVWQRKKFACNADSAEIVQIFPQKFANSLQIFCVCDAQHTTNPAGVVAKIFRCRHCSRLRRRCVLWRKSARLAARSRKICVVKTRISCRIFAVSARGARFKDAIAFPERMRCKTPDVCTALT